MTKEYTVDINIWEGDEITERLALDEGEMFEAGRLGVEVVEVIPKTNSSRPKDGN